MIELCKNYSDFELEGKNLITQMNQIRQKEKLLLDAVNRQKNCNFRSHGSQSWIGD
jgi:hypothetical protein